MELGADVSGPSPDYQMRPILGTFPRHGTGEWLAAGLAPAVELQTKVPEDYVMQSFAIIGKSPTSAFTFKTLLRHYVKRALTLRYLNVKLGLQRNYHKGRAGWLA